VNLEQVRAHDAFTFVQGLPAGQRRDFLQLARKLPVMLQTNGLLAAWAHLLAKSGSASAEHRSAVEALLAHLASRGLAAGGQEPEAAFLGWTSPEPGQGLSGLRLRELSAEALAYSVWLKRAAGALCDTGGAGAAGGGG
jgi:hypothetical protein